MIETPYWINKQVSKNESKNIYIFVSDIIYQTKDEQSESFYIRKIYINQIAFSKIKDDNLYNKDQCYSEKSNIYTICDIYIILCTYDQIINTWPKQDLFGKTYLLKRFTARTMLFFLKKKSLFVVKRIWKSFPNLPWITSIMNTFS